MQEISFILRTAHYLSVKGMGAALILINLQNFA